MLLAHLVEIHVALDPPTEGRVAAAVALLGGELVDGDQAKTQVVKKGHRFDQAVKIGRAGPVVSLQKIQNAIEIV